MQSPPRQACSMAGSNKLTVVMRMTCDDRCNAARLRTQFMISLMLVLGNDLDPSLVMSLRGSHERCICVELATGDITVQELSTSGCDCRSCEMSLLCFVE